MKKTLLALVSFAALAAPAAASDSFQFAPPPFPILNLRAVDAQQSSGFTGISQKVGDFTFGAGAFGGARTVKKWDSGGISMGGNYLVIGGSGKFDAAGTGTKSTLGLFGMGFSLQPNIYFDLFGQDEDDFSLPIYFGPHLNLNTMFGSMTQTSRQPYICGTSVCYRNVATYISISMSMVTYGWQAGVQAGINLGDGVKFVPYLDFSQDAGGTATTSVSTSYGSTSTSTPIKAMPVAMTPGFDLMFRDSGFSLGGASQALENATKGGAKTKTIIVNLRWTKKFRSICGI